MIYHPKSRVQEYAGLDEFNEPDAAAVLRAIARMHPEPADLVVEACVLSFHMARMDRAVHHLAKTGLVQVEGMRGWANLPAQRAHLTEKGVAAVARAAGCGVETTGRLGRRGATRPVQIERRRFSGDRRAEYSASL